jgi:very-short-patch-repair endonuclease
MSPSGVLVSTEVLRAERKVFGLQLGLATRAQLRKHGLSDGQIRTALAQGRWVRGTPGVYALTNWPTEPPRRLLAACFLTGGVASHASAAWFWGLLDNAPEALAVSVHSAQSPDIPSRRAHRPLAPDPGNVFHGLSIVVHRSNDLVRECVSMRRGVPVTNPLRALVDMAANSPPALLDEAVDAALASRLVTVEGLTAEAMRLKGPGRRGPARLMKCLAGRGFVGAPAPSALESRALRLLSGPGIKIERCETEVRGLGYRLDIQLQGPVFVEVDGYAYHWSPEQKRYDDARRNRLRLAGFSVLVYDWRTVVNEPGRLLAEVRQALSSRPEAPAFRPPR